MPSGLLPIVVCALWVAQPEQTASLDRSAYLNQLEGASTALEAASTLEDARAIAASIPDRWFVRTEPHINIVDTSWIDVEVARAGDPARWRDRRDRIVQRLAAMRAEAAEPNITETGAVPSTRLAEVLARPEFQQSEGSRWFEEQRKRITDWLVGLLERFTGNTVSSRSAAIVLAWIASLLALGALTFWLTATLLRRSRAATLGLAAAQPKRAAAREWALLATEAIRAGDVREAVRCGYHAAVCRLDEQGIWRMDDSRTPREYLRLLQTNDPRCSLVSDLTRQFEQVWYGRRMATDDDARRMAEHLERLGCLRAADRAI